MNSKMHLILERFWLGVAILATVVTTIYAIEDGFYNTRIFWLITGISWAMFFVRRGMRKRMEKISKTKNNKTK